MRKLIKNTKEIPKIGDRRYTIKFAWFPIIVTLSENIKYSVWLEKYIQVEEFQKINDYTQFGIFHKYKWIKIENVFCD